MSMRRQSHSDILSVAVITAAAMGVTIDMPLTTRRRNLPDEQPCLNCGRMKQHANAFCSSKCCREWKNRKRGE